MKKVFGKLTVLVLSLLMVFAMGACGDNTPNNITPVNNAGEALSGAAAEMLKQDGITVKLGGTVSVGENIKNVGLGGEIKLAKNGNDYDYSIKPEMVTTVSGQKVSMPITNIVRKDGISFMPMGGAQTIWSTGYSENIFGGGFDLTEITEMLGQVNIGDLTKTATGYTLSLNADYGEYLNNFKSTLISIKGKKLHDLLFAPDSGITEEQLTAVINLLFADNATLKTWIETADGVLVSMNTSVKQVINEAFAEQGFANANALYEQLKTVMPTITKPAATDTVYDYLLSLLPEGEDTAVNDIIEFVMGLMGGIGTAPNPPETEGGVSGYTAEDDTTDEPALIITEIRNMILGLISEQGPDLDEIYDEFAAMISDPVEEMLYEMPLSMIGNASAWDELLNSAEPLLAIANIEKLTFGENKFELNVELNGNLTIKNIKIIVKNDIKYKVGTEDKALVALDVNVNLGFSYGKTVIALPSFEETDLVKPCICAPYDFDVNKLTASGYSVNVYLGKGYDIGKVTCDNEELDGLTYANGKITFSAAAVKEIIAIVEEKGYAQIELEWKQTGTNEFEDYMWFRIRETTSIMPDVPFSLAA